MANEAQQSDAKEFFVANGKKLLVILVIILAGVAGVVQYKEARTAAIAAQNDLMGNAMSYLYANAKDEALAEFEAQINSGKLDGLTLAKAALFAGNLKFEKQDFDGAAAYYAKSLDNAGSSKLVSAAALHGAAAVSMEKGDFAKAASQLEKFVSEYGKRTGDLKDRYQKDEPVDEVPMVADAMWKLTLCYKNLGNNDKAKATAERILKVYGDNRTAAANASRFLASL